ncbi:malonyl-ACP O-methyltransferase BioC [bacterium]|nr:malonyl-ACP O-methyltransferase BioC [bacterium]
MQSQWITKKNNDTLILYFSGWAMDGSEVSHLESSNCDLLAFYDYRELSLPKIPRNYKRYILMAWSFGVFVAAHLKEKLPIISHAVAINGTLNPIDQKEGIPLAAFDKTHDTLSDKNLLRFLRSITGEKETLNHFLHSATLRNIDHLQEELVHLKKLFLTTPQPANCFNKIYISSADTIFKRNAQRQFWNERCDNIDNIQTPHLPFHHFSSLMEITHTSIFKEQIIKKFSASFIKSYNEVAIVQQEMAGHLIEVLKPYNLSTFSRIFELGYGTGFLTKQLLEQIDEGTLWLNDISSHKLIPSHSQNCKISYIHGDAEHIFFPKDLDMIISSAVIQWFENLPLHFKRAHKVLKPGGILAFTTFGPQNFLEIKELTGIGLTYHSIAQFKQLLDPYFTVEIAQESLRPIYFPTPRDVLLQMKDTGVNSLVKTPWGPQKYREFYKNYIKIFGTTDGIPLTYHPMIVIATKR